MTDPARDVDAAVAWLAPLQKWPWMRSLGPEDARAITAVCTALAEARQQIASQAQEIARLQEELDRTVRCSDDCERVRRQDAQDAADAQRERDAQQLDEAADELYGILYGISRANTNIARILREEATKMRGAGRASRTPQEPTGAED